MNKIKVSGAIILLISSASLLAFSLSNFLDSKKSQDTVLTQRASQNSKQNAKQILGKTTNLRGEEAETKKQENIVFQAEGMTAKSFLVYDTASQRIILEYNIQEQLPIASLTKLLTAAAVYENVKLSSEVDISAEDKINVAPKLNLEAGDTVLALDLFNSMLIGSNNDAAKALARFVEKETGENFVGLMNKKAQQLKMTSSHFSNPFGFDSNENFSTAEDILKLVLFTQQFGAFTNLGKKTSHSFFGSLGNEYTSVATNGLVEGFGSIESIKTGFTKAAKESMATKISKLGKDYIILVIGSDDRDEDTLKIIGHLPN